MRVAIPFALACTWLAFPGTPRARAEFIRNPTGIANPAVVVRFDELGLAPATPVAAQYLPFGVTFSPGVFQNPLQTEDATFPHIDTHRLGNFQDLFGENGSPFSILFATPQTEAAFALVSALPTTTVFTALLAGVPVESATPATDFTSTNNFYGFVGVTFDEIRVNVGTSAGGKALIDNLQMGQRAAAVPEPSGLLLGAAAATAAALWARLRRRPPGRPARRRAGGRCPA